MPAKMWPLERYAILGKELLRLHSKLSLIVLGGKEDALSGEALCREWGPRAHNLAGKLTLHGSAAVLERCAGYVGNDTGTMHLAAMVGRRCVALFSARDTPGKWEPYGTGHSVLRHEVECSGCMREICNRNNTCLRKIDTDDVLIQVERLLMVGQTSPALTAI